MKKHLFLTAFWLVSALAALAQSTVTFPKSGKIATEAYVDSVVRALTAPVITPPVVVLPPVINVPLLSPCQEGPQIRKIYNVTPTNLQTQFHGVKVSDITWQISSAAGLLRTGSIEPRSNVLDITYQALPPGSYLLKLYGKNCQGRSEKAFIIANVGVLTPAVLPPVLPPFPSQGTSYDLLMNLTGYGFSPQDPQGMNPEWVERIEAFRYSWGYGITGIRLCVRWHQWEPTPGNFQKATLQKIIAYCRARNLKLAVFFWPFRDENDGFIPPGQAMQGHRGTTLKMENRLILGSMVSQEVNQKMYAAIEALSAELATYEKSHSVALGSGLAEEYINPTIGVGESATPEITGFEPIFQEGFRQFRKGKNQPYQRPEIVEWTGGVGLQMGNEVGKDFARYISLNLTNHFESFTKAVKKGSNGKLLSVYMYPDAGNPQNAWFLHSNFAAQAAAADMMYGTDGDFPSNIDRKLLCNAIAQGMGKLSMIEYDPTDLASSGPYCSGIDLGLMEREYEKAYQQGTHVVAFAMAFCPEEIRNMEPHLKRLHEKYIGKPYTRPNWPTTEVSITPAFWKGEQIYSPFWKGDNWLRPDDTDFWGQARR